MGVKLGWPSRTRPLANLVIYRLTVVSTYSILTLRKADMIHSRLLSLCVVAISVAASAHAVMTPEECELKYEKLIDKEEDYQRLKKLDAEYGNCLKRGKNAPNRVLYIGHADSGGTAKEFPASGYFDGLAGFLKANRLVVTSSDSSCELEKPGICRAIAYITRNEYPKHRPNEAGSFCGKVAFWESPKMKNKKWTPVNGLSSRISEGNATVALWGIDEKNESFCK